MTHPQPNRHAPTDWPVDTDVETGPLPINPAVVSVILFGGFVGGLVRYEVVKEWSAPSTGFPWSTFVVNTVGALVLAVLVIVTTDVLTDSRLLRPLIGTGFCGALTTFSSVAVQTDELAAHGRVATAASYLAASLAAGAAAAWVGVLLARAVPTRAAERGKP